MPETRFRLLRYFSIACLAALVLAVVGLGFFFRTTALSQLVRVGEENNAGLARVLSNTLAPRYVPLIDVAGKLHAADITASPQSAALQRAVLDAVRHTHVVKVAIYDASGRIVYSSDVNDTGKYARTSPGVAAALAGSVTSALSFHDTFDAFGETIAKRQLLVSHVPVRRGASNTVDAVFELHSDVTPFYDGIRRTQRDIRAGAAIVMVLLYAALFLIVKRADNLIGQQDAQRTRNEETIRHLAHHDSLTDLPNRKLFADRLSLSLARAKRYQSMAALIYIDLDRFKEINDTLGHAVGDTVLKAAARRLRGLLREIDTVGRLGGDEFTLIIQDVPDAAHAATVAEKIKDAFAAPVTTEDGVELYVTPSIGVALYPVDADNVDGLLDAADAAMYAAKAAGRNTWKFYERSTMAVSAREPAEIAQA